MSTLISFRTFFVVWILLVSGLSIFTIATSASPVPVDGLPLIDFLSNNLLVFQAPLTVTGLLLAALLLSGAVLAWSWTLRRTLDARLARSKERYRILAASLDDGLCVFDENCNITYLNEKTCAIIGTRFEDLLGRKVTKLFPPVLPENRKIIAALKDFGGGKGKTIETTITNDEEKISVTVSPHNFLDEKGNPNGGYLLIRDISAHKKTEQALLDSEQTFSAVFDNSPAAISLRDTDGKYRLANKQFLQWFGVSRAEIIGKTVEIFLPPDRAEKAMNDDQWVLMVGEVLEREIQIERPNTNSIHVSLTKFPVKNRENEIIGVGTILVDVSREREAEARLRQAQKMEVVGQLTGGISHDFNNLLTVINGNLELVLDVIEEPDSREMLEDAKSAALLGADLTHRLLSFSSRQTLNPVEADLNKLVKEFLPLMNRSLGESVTITRSMEEDLWPCEVDTAQLQNAILNLAVNARDAMPSGGELVIATKNILLQDTKLAMEHDVLPGEYVMISVSDAGCGMSQDVLDHVFEPFFTTKGHGKGSGLGLSMVYGFTKQSGGYMTIDSTEDVGTTVCLYLAKLQAGYEPAKPDPVEKGRTSNLRAPAAEKVLIVEDHPNVRKLSKRFLNELGYTTLEAENGQQAIELLRTESGINLLFTDAVLPGGISGIDIARSAQTYVPGIKILMTTGYSEEFLENYNRTKVEFQRLNKPFGKYELAKRLRVLLDNEPSPLH